MAAGPIVDRNQDATIYVGGLDEKCTEAILWELFVQGGPVVSVHMPKDRITGAHQSFGFVEFMSEEDADYAIKIMNMIKLYGKPIRVNKASAHQKNLDIGANIFVGNLDPEVDEKLLYDTFSAFGVILQVPKIMRDPDTGGSKGFAFVNFASFEASDASIEAMNGQYLCNRPISVSYAFKKDTKGERHGTAAERMLAKTNPLFPADRPHQLFADAPAALFGSMRPPPPPMGGTPHIPPPPPPSVGGMHRFPPMPPGMPPMMPPPPPPSGAPTPMPPPPPSGAPTPMPPPPSSGGYTPRPPMSAPPGMWGPPPPGMGVPPVRWEMGHMPGMGQMHGMSPFPPPPPPSGTPRPPRPPPPPPSATGGGFPPPPPPPPSAGFSHRPPPPPPPSMPPRPPPPPS